MVSPMSTNLLIFNDISGRSNSVSDIERNNPGHSEYYFNLYLKPPGGYLSETILRVGTYSREGLFEGRV